MAVGPLQLEFGLGAGLPPHFVLHSRFVQGLPEDDGFEAPSCRAANVRGGIGQVYSQEEEIMSKGLKGISWKELFSDPTQWWDNRNKSSCNPDYRHKKWKDVLWLNNWYRPAWVDSQPALLYCGMSRHPGSVLASDPGRLGRVVSCGNNLQVERCSKLCEDGEVSEAVDALNLLVQRGCHVPDNLFYRVLKRCIAHKDLVLGRRIHALAAQSGYDENAYLATQLIGLYASHARLEDAMHVFLKVTQPSVYNWASIIFAYARHGEPTRAIGLYRQMLESTVKPDNRIFVAVLKACASAGDLPAGKVVHDHILASGVEPDIFVQTCLVDMYAKCGCLEDAQRVFDRLSRKDVVTWTAMIAGYAKKGMGEESLRLYSGMQQEGMSPPDSVTFVCLLQACARVGAAALQQGTQLHAQIRERGLRDHVFVSNSLVTMYANCGSLENARRVFDRLVNRDVGTWTAMISGYAQQGMGGEALHLYREMKQEGLTHPNSVTFVCLLQACAGMAALDQGTQFHREIEKLGLHADVAVGASLVNMYAKCGSLGDAQRVFDRLSRKDVVTWTAMIAGYAEQGMGEEAIRLYSRMQHEGITLPDAVTVVCLLQACANVAALPLGKQLHAQIEEQGMQADVTVGKSLVNMYAKCGSMVDARHVFDSLPERDMVAWAALIKGYATQGDSEVVFELVDKMRQEGMQPDSITFLSVLTACSHVGLVDEGRKLFKAMSTDYGIIPTIEHYTCMVDLLGRAGHLQEALQVVKTMPCQPDNAVWLTLLGTCRKWSNVGVGREAFHLAVRLDQNNAAAYVLMSNIYADAQMWEEAKEMEARRKQLGALKQPGQSWWSDLGGVVHSFVVGD